MGDLLGGVVLLQDAWELPGDSGREQLRVAYPGARRGADQQVDPAALDISVRLEVLLAAQTGAVRIQDQQDQIPQDVVVQGWALAPDEALPEAWAAAGRNWALRQRRAEQEQPASKVPPGLPVLPLWKRVPPRMARR